MDHSRSTISRALLAIAQARIFGVTSAAGAFSVFPRPRAAPIMSATMAVDESIAVSRLSSHCRWPGSR